jgi:hypothetical protein
MQDDASARAEVEEAGCNFIAAIKCLSVENVE